MPPTHPPLRPFGSADVPAPTGSEAAAFDHWAIESLGVPQASLMEGAGRAAADVAQRLVPEGRIVVLVGGGNNGGDGLVAARTLLARGRDVHTLLVSDRPTDDPLLHGWEVPILADHEVPELGAWIDGSSLVIDAMLGTGISGPPRERHAHVIAAVNDAASPVLALDVPSGVDSDGGGVSGEAVIAEWTVAFGAPKLGTLLHPGRRYAGRIVAVEIGFPPFPLDGIGAWVATPAWAFQRLLPRDPDTHKNAQGRVLVVGGGFGMAGAVVLAARAAFATGAGLVRVAAHPSNREIVQSSLPEAIYVDAEAGDLEEALESSDALVVGPGLGTDDFAVSACGRVMTGTARPSLIDADALNLVASGTVRLPKDGRALLMTPHAGEAARLLERENNEIVDDRPAALRSLVDTYGCAALLKGTPSLVSRPGGPMRVDSQATSDLAVAGMGDTLAGVCGALMARGQAADEAGSLGLFLSGRAARIAGRGTGLTPSDVIRWLPEAGSRQPAARSDLGLPCVLYDADPAR